MEIIHHFGLRISSDRDRQEFLEAGIQLEECPPGPRGGIIASFDISESDPRWAEAARVAARFEAIDTIMTRFTEGERESAKYLGILASSYRGYPEPSNVMGFLKATYDLTEYCARCGIGRRQVRPFRMKKAPKLHNSLLQLNWVFDEFFVSPEVWVGVFKPMGIGCRPVLLGGTEAEIDESVVQLDIAEHADLALDESRSKECPSCGRRKWPVSLRGRFPEPAATKAPMFRSHQHFGSGAGASQLIFVSDLMYRKMKEASLKGIEFYPCEASGV